jgi:hypothetical protein
MYKALEDCLMPMSFVFLYIFLICSYNGIYQDPDSTLKNGLMARGPS